MPVKIYNLKPEKPVGQGYFFSSTLMGKLFHVEIVHILTR
jgi:hypothetical protein